MTHFHFIILGFNIIPALFAIQVLIFEIRKCTNQTLKSLIQLFLVATILKSVAFCTLQYGWIVGGYDETIGNVETFGWILFDFLNGFSNLAFVLALRLYLRWKNTPNNQGV